MIQIPPITQYLVDLPCERPHCPTQWFHNPVPFRTTVCNKSTIDEIERVINPKAKYTCPIALFRIIHRLQEDETYSTQRVPFSVEELKIEMDIIKRVALKVV